MEYCRRWLATTPRQTGSDAALSLMKPIEGLKILAQRSSQLFFVISSQRQLRPVLQCNEVIAVEEWLHFFYAIKIDHCGAMNTEELRRIQACFERL